MIEELKGSCFYCGIDVGTHAEGHPFALAPMPRREAGGGWALQPVCLMSWYGERCIDHYAEDLNGHWRRLNQKQLA